VCYCCNAATLGKGKFMGKGKGKGISFQTQCQEVCRPKCRLVPKAVCADVQVPYQVSPYRPASPPPAAALCFTRSLVAYSMSRTSSRTQGSSAW
jgi:hypothetical protein